MRWVAALLLCVSNPASADDTPWATGVTDAQKTQAQALLEAGNTAFLERKYDEALVQYTAAVAVWDHPAIRFNMVRALVQLGRNLDAADNLDRALAYGAAPLEDTVYGEALAYQKLLGSQIADLAVTCAQPGVRVTLDGKPFATCPAKQTQRVLAGPHQLVGTKAGLLPRTIELVAVGGQPKAIELALDPLERGARVVHRWRTFVPWTVFGAGFAVAGAGGLLGLLAGDQMRSYDKLVDARCTGRCTDAELADIADLKSGAELKSGLGISLAVVGAATVATGAVMIYLNRGRTVYPEVAPTTGGAMVSLGGAF